MAVKGDKQRTQRGDNDNVDPYMERCRSQFLHAKHIQGVGRRMQTGREEGREEGFGLLGEGRTEGREDRQLVAKTRE